MTERPRRRVALVQRLLPHYRIETFNQIAAELARRGIGFEVHAGAPRPAESLRDARAAVPSCKPVSNRQLPGGAWWQPVLHRIAGADLIILEQANGAIANYPILLRRAFGGQRLAFLGHGAHLQAGPEFSVREAVKRALVRAVDYWFAYTTLSRDIVVAAGFAPDRVTVVENSQPTHPLQLDPGARRAVREACGVDDRPVAVFCGRLTEQKKIPFIVAGCAAARAQGLDLQLLVIGDGPLDMWLAACAVESPWIHPLGPRFGVDKARILAAADVFVMPAGIGLSILDAFAAGLPVAAAAFANHNPEIVYLAAGRNGIMTPPDSGAYGTGLAALLGDGESRHALSAAARATAARYTVENMVANFVHGVEAALAPQASRRAAVRPA